MLKFILDFLMKLFAPTHVVVPPAPVNTPPEAPQSPQTVVVPPKPVIVAPSSIPGLVDVMCEAIKSREGWFPPCAEFPIGSPSYRHNSPGNLRYSNQPGTTGKDFKGFAIFINYQSGYNALKNQILLVAKGKSGMYPNPCTLQQFFNIYAPAGDNNLPVSYCLEVANRMHVSSDFLLSNLA